MRIFKNGDVLINNQGCEYTIIDYRSSINVLIEFNDKYKHRRVIRSPVLKTGGVNNPYHPTVEGVGFIGCGEYKTHEYNRRTKAYTKWQHILQRCYTKNENQRRRLRAYDDCTVHPDWHNFQNFAEWFLSQKYCDKDYEIDKDILGLDCKMYSKDTCCLVPSKVNRVTSYLRTVGVNEWQGIKYNAKQRKYVVLIAMDGYKKYLGTFKNLDDACEAYIAQKKQFLRNIAIIYRDCIEPKVFNALYNWNELQKIT